MCCYIMHQCAGLSTCMHACVRARVHAHTDMHARVGFLSVVVSTADAVKHGLCMHACMHACTLTTNRYRPPWASSALTVQKNNVHADRTTATSSK